MPGPLDGVKVVEFTEIIAGPFAGMLLSDMGADVYQGGAALGRPLARHPAHISHREPGLHRLQPGQAQHYPGPDHRSGPPRCWPDSSRKWTWLSSTTGPTWPPSWEWTTIRCLPSTPRLIYCENTAFGRQGPGLLPPRLRPYPPGHVRHHDRREQDQQRRSRPRRIIARGGHISPESAWPGASAPPCSTGSGRARGQKVETTLLGMAIALLGMRFVEVEKLGPGTSSRRPWNPWPPCGRAGIPYDELLKIYESDHPVYAGQYLLPAATRPPTG